MNPCTQFTRVNNQRVDAHLVNANVRSYHLFMICACNYNMARGNAPPEISDFEKQRLANIAERDALLRKLTSEA